MARTIDIDKETEGLRAQINALTGQLNLWLALKQDGAVVTLPDEPKPDMPPQELAQHPPAD